MFKKLTNVEYGLEKIFHGAQDFLPLLGTDYIELYVGNAKQAAYFYKTAFGFQNLAYAGLETGHKDHTSYVLQQNDIRLVLTSSLKHETPIGEHVKRHGDSVKSIAFLVEDARKAWVETTSRGAVSCYEPIVERDDFGEVVRSAIHAYGDTIHVFVERKNYHGTFMPGYVKVNTDYKPEPVGLKYVDHLVGNVEMGSMNHWVGWYEKVMGFVNFLSLDDKQVNTEYSALMSKVMSNGNGRVKIPVNEPALGKRKSQAQEFLDFNEGPGTQHVAFATDNIIETVRKLKARGVEFLSTPPKSYYMELPHRLGVHSESIQESVDELMKLGILIDADEDGYLLQILTKPVEDRPTMFIEIIQRMGAKSFGTGNFRALFEAIEKEQEKRGTL